MRDVRAIEKELRETEERVKELQWELAVASDRVLKRIMGHVQQTDPNWLWVRLVVRQGVLHAWLNGPKHGDVPLEKAIRHLVPRNILRKFLKEDCNEWFRNPKHRIELIANRVALEFENCDNGVITAVDGDEFKVKRGTPKGPNETERWTRQRLEADLALEDSECWGQAEVVHYLPFRRDVDCELVECPEDLVGEDEWQMDGTVLPEECDEHDFD